MTDYTPDTDRVRKTYAYASTDSPSTRAAFENAFDRWLAQYDMEVREEIRAEVYEDGYSKGFDDGYAYAQWPIYGIDASD